MVKHAEESHIVLLIFLQLCCLISRRALTTSPNGEANLPQTTDSISGLRFRTQNGVRPAIPRRSGYSSAYPDLRSETEANKKTDLEAKTNLHYRASPGSEKGSNVYITHYFFTKQHQCRGVRWSPAVRHVAYSCNHHFYNVLCTASRYNGKPS